MPACLHGLLENECDDVMKWKLGINARQVLKLGKGTIYIRLFLWWNYCLHEIQPYWEIQRYRISGWLLGLLVFYSALSNHETAWANVFRLWMYVMWRGKIVFKRFWCEIFPVMYILYFRQIITQLHHAKQRVCIGKK
jgi:hypothetical protein